MATLSTTENSRLMAEARAALAGRWTIAALTAALYFLICFLVGLIPPVGGLLQLLIEAPLRLGFALFMLATVRGGRPPVGRLFGGFERGLTALGAHLMTALLIVAVFVLVFFVWALLLNVMGVPIALTDVPVDARHSASLAVVAGFALASVAGGAIWLALSMTFFILADEPGVGAVAALRKSRDMMRGNMWKYLCLQLRFLGWLLLGFLTMGIAFFWVIPYVAAASVRFYEDLRGRPAATPEPEPFAFLDFEN
jgi:uncharacterized membrane protein